MNILREQRLRFVESLRLFLSSISSCVDSVEFLTLTDQNTTIALWLSPGIS
jgi:hypothetical protein